MQTVSEDDAAATLNVREADGTLEGVCVLNDVAVLGGNQRVVVHAFTLLTSTSAITSCAGGRHNMPRLLQVDI